MNVAEAVLILAGATGAGAGVAALAADAQRRIRRLRAPSRQARSATAQLVRLERIVEWSTESGMSAHTRLRPVLVEIAEARLVRRGLRLERDVEESQPARAGQLVRPDRPMPRAVTRPESRAGSRRCSTLEAL